MTLLKKQKFYKTNKLKFIKYKLKLMNCNKK